MIKKYLLSIILALVLLASLGSMALGAYALNITVTETSSNAYPMLGCNATLNIGYMASHDFCGSKALDTRVMVGLAEQPHMPVEDRLMFAIPVPADSSQTLNFTTGSSNLTDFYIIPGYSANSTVGYVSISDNDTLELGDNFTIEQYGWVNTDNGSNKNLVYKENAFRTWVSETVSGNITSTIYKAGTATDKTLRTDGAGDYENIDSVSAGTHWAAAHEAGGEYLIDGTAIYHADAYTLESFTPTEAYQINSVTVHWNHKSNDNGFGVYSKPGIRLGTNETTGIEQFDQGDTNWHAYSEALARPGGGSWTIADIQDLQVVIHLKISNVAAVGYVDYVYIKVNYDPPVSAASVTATGVSSDNHTITTTANTTHMWIDIDGDTKQTVTLSGASVSPNSNDWTLIQNNVMPYMDYYEHTVDSVLHAWYQPNDIIEGTTLVDRSYYALDFSTDDYVSVTSAPSLKPTSAITIGVWVNPDTFPANQCVISKTKSGVTTNYIFITNAEKLFCKLDIDGAEEAISTPNNSVVTGSWQYVVMTYDKDAGADNWNVYINGAVSATPLTKTGVLDMSNEVLLIGAYVIANKLSMDGKIALPRIYNRALGQDEITYNYNSGAGRYIPYSTEGLVGEWRMDEGSGLALADSSGEGNNGTITGAKWVNGLIPRPAGSSGTNDGTFHWGSNPSGVSVVLGSLDSSYEPPPAGELETPDVAPTITPPDTMYPADIDMITAMTDDPLYPWFEFWEDATVFIDEDGVASGGIPILLMWWITYLTIALLAFLVSYKYFHNLMVAGALLIGVFGYAVNRGILSFWFVLLAIIILIAFVVMERRQQV